MLIRNNFNTNDLFVFTVSDLQANKIPKGILGLFSKMNSWRGFEVLIVPSERILNFLDEKGILTEIDDFPEVIEENMEDKFACYNCGNVNKISTICGCGC